MGMIRCPKCGTVLSDTASFCTNCGQKFTNRTYNTPNYNANPYNQYNQPQDNTPNYNANPNNQYNQPQYNPTPYNPNPYVQYAPKIPGRGFGISSMVLGIIGIVYSFCVLIVSIGLKEAANDPFYSYSYEYSGADTAMSIAIIYPLILASLSLIFGFCSHSKGYRSGIKTAGFVLGGISLAFCLISFIITSSI